MEKTCNDTMGHLGCDVRIVLAESIMKMLGLSKDDSELKQKVYKIERMILDTVADDLLLEEVFKRDLLPRETCEICDKELEYFFSDNGVLDCARCPDEDFLENIRRFDMLFLVILTVVYLLIGLVLMGVGDALSTTSYKPSPFKMLLMWIFWPLQFFFQIFTRGDGP